MGFRSGKEQGKNHREGENGVGRGLRKMGSGKDESVKGVQPEHDAEDEGTGKKERKEKKDKKDKKEKKEKKASKDDGGEEQVKEKKKKKDKTKAKSKAVEAAA
jgi:hypothetical protein